MIDYGLVMMICKPGKLINNSVHIVRAYHFIRDLLRVSHYVRRSFFDGPVNELRV